MEKKWPFIQWFVTDWLGDPKVSQCEPATRGILFDWLCNMHALDRSGQVTGTREMLARIGRCTVPQCADALQDLSRTNAAEVQERNGVVTVINRRMKREFLARKGSTERVERHRRNAPVTPHINNQEPEPEPELRRQFNQSPPPRAGELIKLTLEKVACDRVVAEILGNKHGWAYENCRVQPGDFPVRQSLVTVLLPFAGRVTEAGVHGAWREAVRRTHGASTDQMVNKTVAGYTIRCFREALAHC